MSHMDETDSNRDPYARMRPNAARSIGCFYCGAGVPWFQCQCSRAVEARDGRRPRPHFIPAEQSPNGRPIIVLDEEALTNGWLKLPRYAMDVTDVTLPTGPDVTKVAIVTADVTNRPPKVVEIVTKIPMTAAERQRAKRARDRERGEETP